jgi:hypothetical protein
MFNAAQHIKKIGLSNPDADFTGMRGMYRES